MEDQKHFLEFAKDMINDIVIKASSEEKDLQSKSFECTSCEGKFSVNSKLEEHIEKVHSGEKFCCDICKIVLKTFKEMMMHVEQAHKELATYACQLCQIQFKSYQEISVHIEEKHEKESLIKTEANSVIKSITDKFKKMQEYEKVNTDHTTLKRANSASPPGAKSKS